MKTGPSELHTGPQTTRVDSGVRAMTGFNQLSEASTFWGEAQYPVKS